MDKGERRAAFRPTAHTSTTPNDVKAANPGIQPSHTTAQCCCARFLGRTRAQAVHGPPVSVHASLSSQMESSHPMVPSWRTHGKIEIVQAPAQSRRRLDKFMLTSDALALS